MRVLIGDCIFWYIECMYIMAILYSSLIFISVHDPNNWSSSDRYRTMTGLKWRSQNDISGSAWLIIHNLESSHFKSSHRSTISYCQTTSLVYTRLNRIQQRCYLNLSISLNGSRRINIFSNLLLVSHQSILVPIPHIVVSTSYTLAPLFEARWLHPPNYRGTLALAAPPLATAPRRLSLVSLRSIS